MSTCVSVNEWDSMSSMLTTSYSSLQKFSECPRQWYLNDYRRLKPIVEKRTGALPFGGRIHSALEMRGNGEDLLEAWHALSAHEYALVEEAGGGNWDTTDLDRETALGLIMLRGLIEWEAEEGEDQVFEVVAVERQMKNLMTVTTPEGEPVDIWLYGKLDQLLRHRETGNYWIMDWKTTANLEEATNSSLFLSPQPRIYREHVRQEHPDIPIDGVRYTVMRKVKRTASAKPPFYWNYDMRMTDYNVNEHMIRVAALTGRMQHTVDLLDAGVPHSLAAPFNPTWRCSSCPFKNVCLVMQMDGMDAAEDMIEDLYIEGDPWERYKKETEEGHEV